MEIQKYKRYAGVWDRVKSFLVAFLILFFLLFLIGSVITHGDIDFHSSFSDIIMFIFQNILINIVNLNITYLISIIIIIFLSFNFADNFFKISLIDKETGNSAHWKNLFKYWWYKFIFFLLPIIEVIIAIVVSLRERMGWGSVIFMLISLIIAAVLWIIMLLISFVIIIKDLKKQSWYEKKAGVLLVIRE